MIKNSYKYEILDSMESTIAKADCYLDAKEAAERYAEERKEAVMVYSTKKAKVVFTAYI